MARSRFVAIFSTSPRALFEIAPRISPQIEIIPPDGVLIEYPARYEQETLHRISQIPDRSLTIGGADNRTVAILAAKTRPGTIVSHGHEESFLADLPVETLSAVTEISRDELQTFSRWGIYRLGQLSRLPATELTARMGQRGLLFQRIARGEEVQVFEAHHEPKKFELSRDLEWELDNLEALSFILNGMLEELCQQLKSFGLATRSIQVALKLVNKTVYERQVQLAVPMHNAKIVASLIRLDLQKEPPPENICSVSLRAEAARPQVFQHSLLHPDLPNPEKFSRTLARLQAIVGEDNVGCPVLIDTHRPDAVEIRPPELRSSRKEVSLSSRSPAAETKRLTTELQLTLRRVRPPRRTEIESRQIVYCAGPWKSSGDWWTGKEGEDGQWARDEWDVELVDGRICRIVWDRIQKEWFLEGVYD